MSWTSILLYFILPLLGIAYLFLKKKFSYLDERGIPHIKPTSMLLGNLTEIGRSMHMADLLKKVYAEGRRQGDVIAGFYSMVSPTLIVTDLDLYKQITVKEFNNFTDRGIYLNEENEPLNANLFFIGGEKWRFLRHKFSPAFTSGKIKSMYNTISDKGENFVQAVEKASRTGAVEVKNISSRFTIDVISSCAFGMESNTLNGANAELVQVVKEVFSAETITILRFFFLNAFQDLSKFLKLRQFKKSVTDYFYEVISSSITYRENNEVDRKDFLEMLVQLKNKGSIDGEISTESRKLTMNECVAQGFIFFFAGADTSSSAISWALTELSLHPEIQDKVRAEILEKTRESKGEITYENLQEMVYLGQVMNETLRKYPSAFLTFRKATEDYKIPGSKHVIKKGEQVIIPNIAIQNDPQFWNNPEHFDPDRFTAEETAKRPNLSFIPFGEGPRNCIGMRFAQVNVKFAIAILIKNFKLKLDSTKTKLPLSFEPKDVNLSPVGGFWVNFEKI